MEVRALYFVHVVDSLLENSSKGQVSFIIFSSLIGSFFKNLS